MTALFRKLGFAEIDAATDGGSALGMMRDRRYGLVLSDLNMKPVNGRELLRQIRIDQDLKVTPLAAHDRHGRSVPDGLKHACRSGVSVERLWP
jgi:CheY-like chemotaxis protein